MNPDSHPRTDPQLVEKAEAWIGDAVLALAAREWILRQKGATDGAMQARMTSNQFLSTVGNPTAIEARIGRLYRDEGLEAAIRWVESELVPRFLKQEKNRR